MSLNAFVKDWLEEGTLEKLQAAVSYLLESELNESDGAGLTLLHSFGLAIPATHWRGSTSEALSQLNLTPARAKAVWAQVISMNEQPDTNHRLLVDKDLQFFVHIMSGKTVYSESLARGLAILSQESGVGFDQLLHGCFDITPYRPWDHDTKIHNLVYRLRGKSFGELSLKTKNRRVFITRGTGVIFIARSCSLRSQCLKMNPGLRLRLKSDQNSERSVQKLLSQGEPLSRQRIQDTTGLSKSTTQRLLNRMIAKGKVYSLGTGKFVSYRFWGHHTPPMPVGRGDGASARKRSPDGSSRPD